MNTPKYSWIILLFLVASGMINQVDKIIIGLVSVPVMEELNLSPSQWGVVGSSFFWFFTFSSIILGGMADSKNTKKMLTWMSLAWLIVQFVTPFVSSLSLLVFTRMILGAGEGAAPALSTAIVGKWFPKHRHGIGFGAVLCGATIGPAFATPLLISLINQYGWKSAFLVMGIVGLIVLVLWVIFGKDSPQEIGLTSFHQEEQHSSTLSKVSWRQFLPHLLSKNFVFIILCGGCAYWLLSVQAIWFPAYFTKVQHFDNQTLKLAVSLPFLFAAISQIGFSMLSDRIYRKTGDIRKARINVAGSTMILSALCVYIANTVNSSAISILFFTLAPGFAYVILSLAPAILMDFFSPKNIGKAQGIYVALASSTSIIAPLVFGYFIQYAATEEMGYRYGFQVTALGMFVIGLLFLIVVRPSKQSYTTIKTEEQVSI
ncbi:MFS transporter [Bacillus cereus]|uniref:MFS transporter n=1 Tax=Bacillus cereus TaxID=1396 RepID=UPI000BF5ECD4|nr:MFS transporter [Bacillus cereus]PFE48297.1 MFS transporter [Bacillus cereus]PFE67593.1 MFS transporter [Bacillus cereus]PFI97840.1 MFS transporter [Bacillus cereus]PFL13741.1 MFS transporter [Bacillus cereus]PGL42087.1 MFS transporter [Bacillus cereus]